MSNMSVRMDFSVMGFKLHVKWNILYRSCFFGVGGSNPVTEHEQTVPACIKSAFPRQEILHGFYWLFDWLIDWGFSPNRQAFSHVTTFVDIEMWSVFENSDTSLAIPSKESTLFFEIHRNRLCVPRGLIVILDTRTI